VFPSIFEIICLILYNLIIFYLILKELKIFLKLKSKYLFEFWSLIEVLIIINSLISIGINVNRYNEFKRINKFFKEKNGYVYINLENLIFLNNLLMNLNNLNCFFGMIKLIRLCKYNKHLLLFPKTLKYAKKELGLFSLMFLLILISFICLFYLLFLSNISSCSTLLKTTQMLFQIILLKFNTKEFIRSQPFLAPFCLSLFISFVIFVYMNVFLSIINRSFRRARQDQNNHQHMFSFMLNKFLRWTKLKKLNHLEIAEERDSIMRSKYLNAIDAFPLKINQLFDTLNKVCFVFFFNFIFGFFFSYKEIKQQIIINEHFFSNQISMMNFNLSLLIK
jgi:hypothetical protein